MERRGSEDSIALELGQMWDTSNSSLVTSYASARKEAKTKTLSGDQLRLRRLSKAIFDLAGPLELTSPSPTLIEARGTLAVAKAKLHERRTNILFAKHASRTTSTADMFRRVQTKLLDNTIRNLVAPNGNECRDSRQMVSLMATRWLRHLQPEPQCDQLDDSFLPIKNHEDLLAYVDDPVEEEDIMSAFKCCKIGKSAGPDGLGIDW